MWSKEIKEFRIVMMTILNLFLLSNAQYNEALSSVLLDREQFVQFNQLKEENQNNQRNQINQIPNNLTVEVVGFNSVQLKWSPPVSREFAVLQYKIKYEKLNSNKHDTITLDSKLRSYLLENLDRDSEYRFKIGAVFVNDNHGPFTKWKQVQTLKELDETHVPDKPDYLIATAKSTRIHLRWSSSANSSIRVREYLISFGINYPDINPLTIDANQNEYVIKDLQPKQEYVIMLRASNRNGPGEPVYATAKTLPKEHDEVPDELDEEDEPLSGKVSDQEEVQEPDQENEKSSNQLETNKLNSNSQAPKMNSDSDNTLNSLNHETDPELLPPLGVKAEVLGSNGNKIRVSWTEPAKKDQSYMVKFNSMVDKTSKGKVRLLNTTDNHILIDDLRPFTKYEFAVKMIKRNRVSMWSMSVVNVTSEALPGGAPRDLIVMPVSNLIAGSNADPLLTNKITPSIDMSNANNLIDQLDNKLTELAYTGSGSLSKQATMKRAKSAISRAGKYRNKFKNLNAKHLQDGELNGDVEEDELSNKSPNSQNYVREDPENERVDLVDPHQSDIKLFDKQAVPGLSAVSLSWREAKQVNGEILGYLISFNRNGTKDWFVHQVHGDHRSTVLRNLLPETVYNFKAQVRNKKGIGPYSSTVQFRTMPDNSSVSTNTLYVIIAIISSISLLLLIVISSLLCKSKKNHPNPIIGNNIYSNSPLAKRRTNSFMPHSPLSANNTLKSMKNRDFPEPLDLWINHDQLELNKLEKNQLDHELSITATPILQRMETFLGRDGL